LLLLLLVLLLLLLGLAKLSRYGLSVHSHTHSYNALLYPAKMTRWLRLRLGGNTSNLRIISWLCQHSVLESHVLKLIMTKATTYMRAWGRSTRGVQGLSILRLL
jgi:hypothetical protein